MSSLQEFVAQTLAPLSLSTDHLDIFLSSTSLALFQRSVYHSSYMNDPLKNYELLEWYGDPGVNITAFQYTKSHYPEITNPAWTDMMGHHIQGRHTLYLICEHIGLSKYIKINKDTHDAIQVDRIKYESLLEDVYEAFIGVVDYVSYTHWGFAVSTQLVYQLCTYHFDQIKLTFNPQTIFTDQTRLKLIADSQQWLMPTLVRKSADNKIRIAINDAPRHAVFSKSFRYDTQRVAEYAYAAYISYLKQHGYTIVQGRTPEETLKHTYHALEQPSFHSLVHRDVTPQGGVVYRFYMKDTSVASSTQLIASGRAPRVYKDAIRVLEDQWHIHVDVLPKKLEANLDDQPILYPETFKPEMIRIMEQLGIHPTYIDRIMTHHCDALRVATTSKSYNAQYNYKLYTSRGARLVDYIMTRYIYHRYPAMNNEANLSLLKYFYLNHIADRLEEELSLEGVTLGEELPLHDGRPYVHSILACIHESLSAETNIGIATRMIADTVNVVMDMVTKPLHVMLKNIAVQVGSVLKNKYGTSMARLRTIFTDPDTHQVTVTISTMDDPDKVWVSASARNKRLATREVQYMLAEKLGIIDNDSTLPTAPKVVPKVVPKVAPSVSHKETSTGPMARYPWKRSFMPFVDTILPRFQRLQSYKPRILQVPFTVRALSESGISKLHLMGPIRLLKPALLAYDASDYTTYNEISDWFAEPVRIDARRKGYPSIRESWIAHHKEITSKTSNLKEQRDMLWKLSNEPSTFRPTNLAALIDMYDAKRILDFSAGWGDRLIAAMAKNVDVYTGYDPNTRMHPVYREIIKTFQPYSDTKVTMIESPFEPEHVVVEGLYDMVFTSPPYFDFEIYTDAKTQSHHYGKEHWYKQFLLASIGKAVDALEFGGHLCIVINEVKGIKVIRDMITDVVKLYGMKYKGMIGYGDYNEKKKSVRNPQPIWVWIKE